jgi:hypothetical protein
MLLTEQKTVCRGDSAGIQLEEHTVTTDASDDLFAKLF